ncbi:hypothetical protein FOL47_009422 [Perkinsus chesapeaki]|uniref:Protein disulfide-isomerase n=1 Tax=Perkinsus chesapeaki TaxID=330153 RepID=A0A7J6L8F6_PERCH|nr:hypothetical protein FOL47_009422 [Perkinsus chesapeaki]
MHRNGLINAEIWDRGILVSKAPIFEELYAPSSGGGVVQGDSEMLNNKGGLSAVNGDGPIISSSTPTDHHPIVIHQEPLSDNLSDGGGADPESPNSLEDPERNKRDLLPVTIVQPEGWESKSNAACMDEWTVSDVGVLLTGLGLGQLRDTFEKNDVDGFVLERLVSCLDDVEDDEMSVTPSNAAGDRPIQQQQQQHATPIHPTVHHNHTTSSHRSTNIPLAAAAAVGANDNTIEDGAADDNITVYTGASSAADELGLADPTLRRILLIVIRMLSKLKQRALMPTLTSQHLHQWFSALEVNYNDIDFQCLVGEGGYGRVYRARYMHKHVACKVFRGGNGGGHDKNNTDHISKDFWSELNTLARLRHPNITLLLGISLTPRYSLLTEYVPCGSLFDLLHRSHPGNKNSTTTHEIGGWSLPRVVSIAREICLGMSYLHSHGVLHCDLKSSNILISENWEVKICDFGLSFMTGESNRDAKLPLGCVGTHHWMAPEILRGEEYSQAADVYSFGMILWEMVYRMIPYAHLSALQVIGIVGYGHRIHHHGPSRPLLPMDDCPMPLRNIMIRSLRYVPDTRPSFAELAAELSRLHKNSVIDVEESMNAFFGLDRPNNYAAHSTWQSTTQAGGGPWSRNGQYSGQQQQPATSPPPPPQQGSLSSSLFLLLFADITYTRAWSLWGDAGSADRGKIRHLTEKELDDDIPQSGISMVMFYAPYCPYCQSFKPFFENAVKKLAMHDDIPIRFGMIDGIEYPNVVNWINRIIDKEHVIETTGDADKFLEDNPFVAIGLFDSMRDGEFFKHSTRHFEDIFFATAYGQGARDIIDHLYSRGKITKKPSQLPAVIALYHHDDHFSIYEQDLDYHHLDRFLLSRTLPLITPYTPEGAESLLSSGMPVLYLFRDGQSQVGKASEADLKEMAKEFIGDVLFSIVDTASAEEHYVEGLTKELGIEADAAQQQPIVRILYHPARESRHISFFDGMTRKFKPRNDGTMGKIDKEFFRTFINDFKSGSVHPYTRSEPIPDYWGNEGVIQVVGDNFEDVVMNDAEDVLVNYFAPWCGHCRQLSSTYSALGDKVKHLKSTLKIVKIDATQNELPLRVDAFPTIMLYPAGRKHSPVYFQGKRTVENFIQFLKQNAVHEIRDKPAVYDQYGNVVESPEEL